MLRRSKRVPVEYQPINPGLWYRIYTVPSEYAGTMGSLSKRVILQGTPGLKSPYFHQKYFIGSQLITFALDQVAGIYGADATGEEPPYEVKRAWELSKFKFRTVREI